MGSVLEDGFVSLDQLLRRSSSPRVAGFLVKVRTRNVRVCKQPSCFRICIVLLIKETTLISKEYDVVEWDRRIRSPRFVVVSSPRSTIVTNAPLDVFGCMRFDDALSNLIVTLSNTTDARELVCIGLNLKGKAQDQHPSGNFPTVRGGRRSHDC